MHRSTLALLLAVAASTLGAQATPGPAGVSRYDVRLGLTINGTSDVNRSPTCTNLGLPCETSGREFPDMGFMVEAALHATPIVAMVAEASVYFNAWDTTGASGAAEHRANTVRALLAGVRVTSRALYPFAGGADPVFVYAQALAGPEASAVVPTRLALQPGIGVYSPLTRNGCGPLADASFLLGWDYRWTQGQPRNLSAGRFVLGVILTQ